MSFIGSPLLPYTESIYRFERAACNWIITGTHGVRAQFDKHVAASRRRIRGICKRKNYIGFETSARHKWNRTKSVSPSAGFSK